MLAGCSSKLLSPRHRLSIESPAQFHLPSMSAQRLDLPCNFARKDANRSQPVRPVGLSIEKPIGAKNASCSLRQTIKLEERRKKKDDLWVKNSKSLKKRYAEEVSYEDETCVNRVKRKRGNGKSDDLHEEEGSLSFGQLGTQNFWFQPGFNVPFSISHSGKEERVCFVPSDAPLPPLSNIPWFDSLVTEIADFGRDRNVETSRGPVREASGSSSTSSDNHEGLVLRSSDNPVERDTGNRGGGHNGENYNREHDCIELVSLLVSCVEQIGSKNVPAINHCLARLGELASPRGGSPIHRLIAYYTEALALRVAKQWPNIFSITIPRDFDRFDDESWSFLNQVSPILKFVHFTSNELLLRAFEGKDRVHVIDFDIKQGLQWPSLFQSLALRSNPPSHVRITGIGESKQDLIETGERLVGFAEALNLPFEFHPVVDRLEDVRLWMLHVKEKETVGINCVFQMHKMMYDNTGGMIKDFLGLIQSTIAEVVVMAEQEVGNNEPRLDARLSNSLRYYSAIFDSVDSSLPLESQVRIKIEEMFGREIRNIIGCEGHERFERHETFGKWKEVMGRNGFRCMGISERELLQGQMLLKMYEAGNYRVHGGGESVTLSWLDQNLYTVSAWSPVDIAGTSSSYHQTS